MLPSSACRNVRPLRVWSQCVELLIDSLEENQVNLVDELLRLSAGQIPPRMARADGITPLHAAAAAGHVVAAELLLVRSLSVPAIFYQWLKHKKPRLSILASSESLFRPSAGSRGGPKLPEPRRIHSPAPRGSVGSYSDRHAAAREGRRAVRL